MTEKDKPVRTGRKAVDRRAKLAFLAVAVVAAVCIYLLQREGPELKGWATDLDEALKQAKAENRRVLVFFTASPKSATARRLIRTTLAKNAQMIARERVVKVNVSLDRELNSDLAVRYKISSLPTFVLLSPEGKELNRREGFVGEVPFHKGFLDCSQVNKPGQ